MHSADQKSQAADRLRQARQRHKIENVFGKLKDWRPIATRYDRGAHTFFSAICIAATVIFWL
ncbi:transposase (plasmid) [Sinorhizobium medicae]|nr:transposase [Sinorhizobium medicae]WQO48686.1 transposase [Sinorhizobium medicae]WQO68935.1 transposase [Sinorhizobium medicae]WQO77615.1 transposase [Sinorhizobium medicae]